jgi:AcrR family transcriptional regulator
MCSVATEKRPHRSKGAEIRRAVRETIGASLANDEGLREQKKRLMRQLISDTATVMFMDRGFEGVRVTEVAHATGVSEKTVYNYFPTKESLLFDREDAWATAIRTALGPGAAIDSPVDAMVHVLGAEMDQMLQNIKDSGQSTMFTIRRFQNLIEQTPALWAAQIEMMGRLSQVAATALAERIGVDPGDPEPQIMSDALMGLWGVHLRAMVKYSGTDRAPAQVASLVRGEVARAARLIDSGLSSFVSVTQTTKAKAELQRAWTESLEARQEVVAAMKKARLAWRQAKLEARKDGTDARRVRAEVTHDVRRAVRDAKRDIKARRH